MVAMVTFHYDPESDNFANTAAIIQKLEDGLWAPSHHRDQVWGGAVEKVSTMFPAAPPFRQETLVELCALWNEPCSYLTNATDDLIQKRRSLDWYYSRLLYRFGPTCE